MPKAIKHTRHGNGQPRLVLPTTPKNIYTNYYKLSSNKHATAPKHHRSLLLPSGRNGIACISQRTVYGK